MNEEIVCYQIEILIPQGTHSYIYSDKIPSDESLKEKYGLFARVGSVEPLMHVIQHRQSVSDSIVLLAEIYNIHNRQFSNGLRNEIRHTLRQNSYVIEQIDDKSTKAIKKAWF